MAAGALPPPVFLLVSLLDRNSPLLPTRRTRRVYRLVTLCFTLEKQECPLILGVFSSTLRCVCFFFFLVLKYWERSVRFIFLPFLYSRLSSYFFFFPSSLPFCLLSFLPSLNFFFLIPAVFLPAYLLSRLLYFFLLPSFQQTVLLSFLHRRCHIFRDLGRGGNSSTTGSLP